MKRRDALKATALLLGGTVAGTSSFLTGCKATPEKTGLFSADDISFLDEVGETILPTTVSSPGAKAAHIGEFMRTMVTDCYDEKEQQAFTTGIATLNARSEKEFGDGFVDLSPEDRHKLLVTLDKEAANYTAAEGAPDHYFSMMKQLTLWGYFSSEPGCTQALRYVAIPGRFDGCVPYKVGEKAWA